MMDVSRRYATRKPRSVAGIFLAAVLGALATMLAVALWSISATVLGGLEPAMPLDWAMLTGAFIGAGIGWMRHKNDTFPLLAIALGMLAAVVWLVSTNFHPLGFGEVHLFWGICAAFISFALAAHLTRYSLRGFTLDSLRRDVFETLLLRVVRAVGYVFFLTIVLFPFYFMVVSSLKSRAELLQNPTYLGIDFGQGLNNLLIGYHEVLFNFDFLRYIGNSTFVAVFTVVITLVLAILGAYAVTRLRFAGRAMLSRSILLIYMFPAIVLVIPLYTIFTQLGLRNTLPGLLIVYPATTVPVALYMLRSYFQALPKDLEEAGMIDGCSRLSVIWRITLPLSLPALASVGLYVFMIAWNEFLFAFMFLDSPEIYTLSRGMVGLNSQEVPRQFLMAGAVIVTVPIMVLFFWFQRYLVSGLTEGGVKG